MTIQISSRDFALLCSPIFVTGSCDLFSLVGFLGEPVIDYIRIPQTLYFIMLSIYIGSFDFKTS